jgi:hypothetical protein
VYLSIMVGSGSGNDANLRYRNTKSNYFSWTERVCSFACSCTVVASFAWSRRRSGCSISTAETSPRDHIFNPEHFYCTQTLWSECVLYNIIMQQNIYFRGVRSIYHFTDSLGREGILHYRISYDELWQSVSACIKEFHKLLWFIWS